MTHVHIVDSIFKCCKNSSGFAPAVPCRHSPAHSCCSSACSNCHRCNCFTEHKASNGALSLAPSTVHAPAHQASNLLELRSAQLGSLQQPRGAQRHRMRLRIPVPQKLEHWPLALKPSNVLFDGAPAGRESAVHATRGLLEAGGRSEDVINGV